MHSIKNGDAKKVPTFEIENKSEKKVFFSFYAVESFTKGVINIGVDQVISVINKYRVLQI